MQNFRTWLRLIENDEDQPYIQSRRQGTTIWIDMIHVPRSQRGQGTGSRYYREWEAKLPKDIALVRLMAADTGSGQGNSDGFWEMQGFEWQYSGDNLDYESEHMMWKGVNGHPTPKQVVVDDDDQDID